MQHKETSCFMKVLTRMSVDECVLMIADDFLFDFGVIFPFKALWMQMSPVSIWQGTFLSWVRLSLNSSVTKSEKNLMMFLQQIDDIL